MTRRIVIASADPALRARILDLLSSVPIEVVREPITGDQALLACTTEEIDAAVLDQDLPGTAGSDVADLVRDVGGGVDVVVVYRGDRPEDEPNALDVSGPDFDRALLSAIGVVHSLDRIGLFVVDDHEMVRRGLRDLAAEEPDIEVVGEWPRAQGAVEEIDRVQPDLALLDLRLPDGDGVELCREIRSRIPSVRCLMFTAHADDEALLRSIMAGAGGYLLKQGSSDDLVEGIRTIAAGGSLIDPAAAESMVGALLQSPETGQPLSAQQERVLELIVEGLTNREIAERLGLAEKTVKNYVSAVLDKLDVRSRTQAAVYGAKRRLQAPPAGDTEGGGS
ncbi:MAG: response regulator [Actinomycetota bacterium]